MKGLLIKDFYSTLRQLKYFILVIFLMTFIPGFSMLTFAIVYATMLPMTAIAYDERSKWDKLAAMMPYSSADITFSKYVMGGLMVVGVAIFACFAQAIVGIFTRTPLTGMFFAKLLLVLCFAFIIEDIELPLLIRFGAEKGRIAIVLLLVVIGVGGATLIESTSVLLFQAMDLGLLLLIALAAAAVLTALSVLLSIKLYEGKKE